MLQKKVCTYIFVINIAYLNVDTCIYNLVSKGVGSVTHQNGLIFLYKKWTLCNVIKLLVHLLIYSVVILLTILYVTTSFVNAFGNVSTHGPNVIISNSAYHLDRTCTWIVRVHVHPGNIFAFERHWRTLKIDAGKKFSRRHFIKRTRGYLYESIKWINTRRVERTIVEAWQWQIKIKRNKPD